MNARQNRISFLPFSFENEAVLTGPYSFQVGFHAGHYIANNATTTLE